MNMEMIGGPQGVQRCEDGGGHLVTFGETIAKGQVLVPDYADASGIAGGTSPNTATYPEQVYVVCDSGTVGYAKQLNAPMCVATEAGVAGEQKRVIFEGWAKVDVGVTIAAGHLEVGLDNTTGLPELGVSTDVIIGRQSGVVLTAGTPGLMWFDGLNRYVKA